MNAGHKWLLAGAVVVLFNLVLLIVFGDDGLVEMHRLRAHEQTLTIKTNKLAKENLRLYRTIDRLHHDSIFIESVARNELGMVGTQDVILLPSGNSGLRK